MNPVDFLAVADALSIGSSEADWRTSIGRAYYGLFASAVLRLQGIVVLPTGADVHRCVRHYLQNSGHPDLRHVAQTLETLRKARNDADYRMSVHVTAAKAQFAALLARKAKRTLA